MVFGANFGITVSRITKEGTMKKEYQLHITTPNASGEYLQALRHKKGLTRREVAEAIGCALVTVVRWETKGVTGGIKIDNIYKIMDTYGTSCQDLLEAAIRPAASISPEGGLY